MITTQEAHKLADALMKSEVPDSLIDEAAVMLHHQADRIAALLGVRDATLDLTAKLAEEVSAGKLSENTLASMLGVVASLAPSRTPPPTIMDRCPRPNVRKGKETTMQITTRHEIKPINGRPEDAQLVVHVAINGQEGHSFVAMSGPKTVIEEFVRDEIDLTEVERRFSFRNFRRSA